MEGFTVQINPSFSIVPKSTLCQEHHDLLMSNDQISLSAKFKPINPKNCCQNGKWIVRYSHGPGKEEDMCQACGNRWPIIPRSEESEHEEVANFLGSMLDKINADGDAVVTDAALFYLGKDEKSDEDDSE